MGVKQDGGTIDTVPAMEQVRLKINWLYFITEINWFIFFVAVPQDLLAVMIILNLIENMFFRCFVRWRFSSFDILVF